MNVIRQNTDYALRAMVHLAAEYGNMPISARKLAQSNDISYQFTCKIMQKLSESGLVGSVMGPKGGFQLTRSPEKVNLLEVVAAIQGPICLNNCLLSFDVCPLKPACAISNKLVDLQEYIDSYLSGISLADLLESRCSGQCQKN